MLTWELSVCASSFRAGSLVEVSATLSLSLSKKSYIIIVVACEEGGTGSK
jgi:hypothetical protein